MAKNKVTYGRGRGMVIVALLLLCGCASVTAPMPSGYLAKKDYSRMRVGKYFKQENIAKGVDLSKYEYVKITPIDFSFLEDKTIASPAALDDLSKSFSGNIQDELSKHGYKIPSGKAHKTLVLNVAVTKIEQPNVPVNVTWKVATGIVVPFPIVPNPMHTKGSTAFEAKITDEATGKILVEIAEEQSGRGERLDVPALAVGSYIYFVNTKAVFQTWAGKIGTLLEDLRKAT